MTTKEKELVKAYKKYINFLTNSYIEVFDIARVHNYVCSDEDFELGQQLRDNIKQLEEECGMPDNNILMDYLY